MIEESPSTSFSFPILDPIPIHRQKDNASALRIERVQSIAGLHALKEEWDSLFQQSQSAVVFNSWEWITSWWRTFGRGKRLLILAMRERTGDTDRLVAIAPFMVIPVTFGPFYHFKILLQIGKGNVLTERLEVLTVAGREAELTRRCMEYIGLHQELWDYAMWMGVQRPELPPSLAALVTAEESSRYEVRSLPGTWEVFLKNLNKSMRDNVKYYPNLLVRQNHPYEIRIITDPREVPAALEHFYRLHSARAALTDTKHHDDRFGEPAHRAFLDDVAPKLAAAGLLRIYMMEIEGAVVAVQLTLRTAGTLGMYYSGFDPEWRKYGIATVVAVHAVRDAISEGVTTLDFLTGTGQFKQRWDTETVTVPTLSLARRTIAAQAFSLAYHRLKQMARQQKVQAEGGVSGHVRVMRTVARLLRQQV